MVQYSFRVGTPTGSIQTLEVAEDSPEAARRILEGKGYFVFDHQEQERTLPRFGRPAFLAPRITPRALLVFNQELLALVRAGLPIISALDLLRERDISRVFEFCSRWWGGRDQGRCRRSSAAMARIPRCSAPCTRGPCAPGSRAGNFVDALTRYVEYQKRILRCASVCVGSHLSGDPDHASLAVIVFSDLRPFRRSAPSTATWTPSSRWRPGSSSGSRADSSRFSRWPPWRSPRSGGPLAVAATPEGRRLTDRWILVTSWVDRWYPDTCSPGSPGHWQ